MLTHQQSSTQSTVLHAYVQSSSVDVVDSSRWMANFPQCAPENYETRRQRFLVRGTFGSRMRKLCSAVAVSGISQISRPGISNSGGVRNWVPDGKFREISGNSGFPGKPRFGVGNTVSGPPGTPNSRGGCPETPFRTPGNPVSDPRKPLIPGGGTPPLE